MGHIFIIAQIKHKVNVAGLLLSLLQYKQHEVCALLEGEML